MKFSIVGQGDPFLHVSLKRGEKIYCESDAMVSMEPTLELTGKMQGGLLSALARKMVNEESFFTQFVEAVHGDGDILLSPEIPGDIQILDCTGQQQYLLNDSVFVAADTKVDLKVKRQGIGQALFGGSGGFFVTQTSGEGQVAVAGFGTVMELEITPTTPQIIDNYHVVAWDSRLRYTLSTSTRKSAGIMGNLINSVTSGEGIVCKFEGTGKVYVCSRNRNAFLGWLSSKLTPNRG